MDARDLLAPLVRNSGWIKFLGIAAIVYGVILILSIFGIILAWLPLWMGVLLFQASQALESYHRYDIDDEATKAVSKITLFLKIAAIATAIGLALSILWFLVIFVSFSNFFLSLLSYAGIS